MGVPIVYRRATEANIASFEYTEIASGRAIKKLYLCDGEAASGAILTKLTEGIVYARLGTEIKAYTQVFDVDFDMLINRPIRLKGGAIVSIPVGFSKNTGTISGAQINIEALLRYVRNSVEYEIASANNQLIATDAVQAGQELRSCIFIDVPLTKLQANDTLRLTIKTSNPPANTYTAITYDPKSRSNLEIQPTAGYYQFDWSLIGSDSFILLPIMIDL